MAKARRTVIYGREWSCLGEVMKIISHRGLVDGPNKELENNPHQILKMLEAEQK